MNQSKPQKIQSQRFYILRIAGCILGFLPICVTFYKLNVPAIYWFYFDTSVILVLSCIPALVFYPLIVSFMAYDLARSLNKTREAMKRQNQRTTGSSGQPVKNR